MQNAINFNDVAIFSVKGSDYRIHFWYMSKDDAINIMNNSNLNKKVGCYQIFSLHIKMSQTTYQKRNRDVILKRAKEYFENDKKSIKRESKTQVQRTIR